MFWALIGIYLFLQLLIPSNISPYRLFLSDYRNLPLQDKWSFSTPWKVVILIEVFMAVLIIGVFVIWMQVQFPMGLFAYIM